MMVWVVSWIFAIIICAIPVVLLVSITLRHAAKTARIMRGRE